MQKLEKKEGYKWVKGSTIVDEAVLPDTEDISAWRQVPDSIADNIASTFAELQGKNELQIAKAEKIAEVVAYDNSSAVNEFTIGGVQMWIDYDERSRIRQSIEVEKARGKSTMVKYFLNTKFEYPLEVWLQMITALSGYAIDANNVTEEHKMKISALTTVDDVKAYDYKQGYPQKLTF